MNVLLLKEKKSENIVDLGVLWGMEVDEELKGDAQLEKQVWISLKVDAHMLICTLDIYLEYEFMSWLWWLCKILRFYSHNPIKKFLSHLEKIKQIVASRSNILLTWERVNQWLNPYLDSTYIEKK